MNALAPGVEDTVERQDDATAPAAAQGGLQALFEPAGVLVVGASHDPAKLGGAMAARLAGYAAPIALVNSRGGEGMHSTIGDAVRAVAEAGGSADLAVLCIPAASCPGAVGELADHGVRAVLICAGGFSESGPEGALLEQHLLEVARERGVRVLGPNTSGFFVPRHHLSASFVPGVESLLPGQVAVVAASGGLNHALAFALQRDGVGLSLGVGIGAGIDVTAVDVLRHLADDDATTAVALHLESVTDGRALLEAVRLLSSCKPLVALVVGQHDVGEFAQSHTGALATSWRTTRALLRQAGAVLVDRADDLVVAASVLAQVRLPAGSVGGVGLVTAQAGPGLLLADAFPSGGVDLPALSADTLHTLAVLLPPLTYQANPVDTGRPGPHHAEVVQAVSDDPAVDLVALYGLLEPVVDLLAVAGSVSGPVVVGLDGPDGAVRQARDRAAQHGIPVAVGAPALACAVTAVVQDARRPTTPPPVGGSMVLPALVVGAGPWDEAQAKDLLDALGISTPQRRVCRGRDEAHAALGELGGPVVVKVCDAAILHKSDVGGVHVGITDHADLDVALDRLAALGNQPTLVERMAPPGVDLVVGAHRDPVFGPVVVCGIGGTSTEVYADVAIASVPATPAELQALPDQLAGRVLLEGFRGGPVVDRAALADVAALVGGLLLANDHLTDVEINPLRVTHDGLLALDAVLVAGKDLSS